MPRRALLPDCPIARLPASGSKRFRPRPLEMRERGQTLTQTECRRRLGAWPTVRPVSPRLGQASRAKSSANHQFCLWRGNACPAPLWLFRRGDAAMSAGGSASLGRGGVLAGAGAAGRARGRQRRTGPALGRLVQLWTRSTVASCTSLIRRLGRLVGAATSLRWSTKTETTGLWTRPHLSRVECLRPSIGLAFGYDRPRGRPV